MVIPNQYLSLLFFRDGPLAIIIIAERRTPFYFAFPRATLSDLDFCTSLGLIRRKFSLEVVRQQHTFFLNFTFTDFFFLIIDVILLEH